MFCDYLFYCRVSIIFKKFLALIPVTLLIVACSTAPPKTSIDSNLAKNNNTISPSKIARDNKNVPTTASDTHATPNEDFIADWAKERSEYLRSLDFELIDQQNNTPTKYTIKSNLINTRFYLNYAERLLFVGRDILDAKNKISHAVQEYKKALNAAGNNKTEEMLEVKSELRFLDAKTHRVQPSYRDYPSRTHFKHVENKIEDLLVKL